MAKADAAERRETPYIVLKRNGEAWQTLGEWSALTGRDACKDAAGRDPNTAAPGDYWAVPARTKRNRLRIGKRTESILWYDDISDGEAPVPLEEEEVV